jgi:hypothetical protein
MFTNIRSGWAYGQAGASKGMMMKEAIIATFISKTPYLTTPVNCFKYLWKMNIVTSAIFVIFLSFLLAQIIVLEFPDFEVGKEIIKLSGLRVESDYNDPSITIKGRLFSDISSYLLEKLADNTLSYEIKDFVLFKLVKVSLRRNGNLYWIGILGKYYFIWKSTPS